MTTPPRAPHRSATLGIASLLAIALATGAFAGSPADAPATAADKAKPAAGASGSSCCAPTSGAPAKSAVKRTVEELSLEGLTLVDMDGREVALDQVLDTKRPVLLNFIFTTCTTICPVMTATFAQMRRELGPEAEKIRLVSISIDPEHDSPAVLAGYAERFGAPPGWTFLTGSPKDVEQVLRSFDAWSASKTGHRPITLLRRRGESEWVRLEGLGSGAALADQVRGVLN